MKQPARLMRTGRVAWTVFVGVLAFGLLALAGYAVGKQPALMLNQRMVDCRMRCNEAHCVRMGVDPYDVWKGRTQVPGYVPWNFAEAVDHHEVVPFREYVHAYPPWAYTLIMPLTWLDPVFSCCCWLAFLWCLAIAGTCAAFVAVYRKSHRLWLGFVAVSVVWLFGSSLLACLFYGNYGIFVACAVAAAICLHGRGLDVWAGVAWTLAMVKPQSALLFAIPLVCLRKWKTLGMTALLLAGLTAVPCVLCHRTPLTMILSIADYSAGQFFETGFIAQSVFIRLVGEGGVPPSLLTMGSAVVGTLICGVITMALASVMCRKNGGLGASGTLDLAIVFLPALVLSTVWTAARGHDYSIQAVTGIVLICLSACCGYSKLVRVSAAVMILVLAISPFETAFGFPINVVRMTSVFGLVILAVGLTGHVKLSWGTHRFSAIVKLATRCTLALVFTCVAINGVFLVGKSMNAQLPLVRNQQMIDFHMRRNEACCVSEGVDPFFVWRGDISDPRFIPWNFAVAKNEHEKVRFRRFVHAYPPWEYTLMLPFTWMNERDAGSCYIGIMYLSLAFLSCMALLVGYRLSGHWWLGCALIAVVWRFYVPYACCIMYGNYGVVIAALMAAALWCQVRGKDVSAGILWTMCFVKPQVAVILLIPLLMLRKWRTLLTVGGSLATLTLVPSVLCQRSPWEMIVCIREYSANQFNALALISESVFQTLTEEGGVAAGTLIMCSSLAVGAICLLLTSFVTIKSNWRCESHATGADWMWQLVVFVPALLLSTIWTSARLHDLSVQSVTAGVMIVIAFSIRDVRVRVVSVLLGICLCWQYVDVFMRWNINVFQVASVVLLWVWCWTLARWCDGTGEQ